MEAPSTWTLSSVILAGPVEASPPGQGMLTTKAVKPFQRTLVCTMERVDASETADGFLRRQVKAMKEAGVARQEAAPPEKVRLGSGHEGLVVEQIVTNPGGERIRQMQLVFIKDGIAHVAVASHLDGASFEAVRQEFRSMLLSFE
jgi:hypothetical protein